MTTPKEQRERNKYSTLMYKNICNHLNRDIENDFRYRMDSLILDNIRCMGNITATFLRNGKMYVYGNLDRRAKRINGQPYETLNRELHPSLHKEFDTIIKEYNERVAASKKAMFYISAILIASKTIQDVKRLIPGNLTKDITLASETLFNSGNPMTSQEIAAFRDSHKEGEEAFIKLSLLEMIRG